MEYIVKDRYSLGKLKNDKSLKLSILRIRIQLPGDEDFDQIEKQINKSYFACGCKEGSIAVFAVLVIGFTAWLTGIGLRGWVWWQMGLAVALAALLGKFFGLGVSRIRLNRALRKLKTHCEDG